MRILFLFLTFSGFCCGFDSEKDNLEFSNLSTIEHTETGSEGEFKKGSDLNVSKGLDDSQIESYPNQAEYDAFLNYLKENLPDFFQEFKNLEYGEQVKLDAIEEKSSLKFTRPIGE